MPALGGGRARPQGRPLARAGLCVCDALPPKPDHRHTQHGAAPLAATKSPGKRLCGHRGRLRGRKPLRRRTHARAQKPGQSGPRDLCGLGVQKPVALLALGLYRCAACLDRRAARSAPRHGAPPQRVFAAYVCAVFIAGPPRRPCPARQPGHARAHGLGGAGAQTVFAGLSVHAAIGRRLGVGARTGLGGLLGAGAHGAQARRAD